MRIGCLFEVLLYRVNSKGATPYLGAHRTAPAPKPRELPMARPGSAWYSDVLETSLQAHAICPEPEEKRICEQDKERGEEERKIEEGKQRITKGKT